MNRFKSESYRIFSVLNPISNNLIFQNWTTFFYLYQYLCISWRMATEVWADPEFDPWRCCDGDVGDPWATILVPGPTKDMDMIPAPTDPGLAPLPWLATGPIATWFGTPPKNEESEAEEECGDAPGWWTMPTPGPAICEGDGRSIDGELVFPSDLFNFS